MSIEINFLTSMKALISKNADIFKNITNYRKNFKEKNEKS
jgi:hypothetical protein